LASKNKTTITTGTQDAITQQELEELSMLQRQLARLTASCQSRQDQVSGKLRAGAAVEPGRFFWTGTAMELRP
jgi:hypothetical protein